MDIERLKELRDYLRVANELSILNDDNLMQRIVDNNDVTNTIDIAIELLNAEIARQSVTDEAVQRAIEWLEAEKASAQNDWERAGAEWRMEPVAKEQHDERMASFDLAIQALCQMKPSEWIPVSERLPESGKEVLMNVAYNNRNQSKYDKVTKGFYVERFSIKEETWSDFTGNEDYCEEDDTYYIRQGWYSVCNFVDDFSYIDVPSGFTVTHWMPLPNPPESEV